ncbi:MAG: LCP family protein [Clostridia bacterium]|nr:LCP family protein [Clostridia bacterium]
MDDLFFTNDNRSSKNGSGPNRKPNEPKFEMQPSDDDYFDLFSNNNSSNKKFKVTLPSDESVFSSNSADSYDISSGRSNIDRTPKGKPLGTPRPSQDDLSFHDSFDRTPKGARKAPSSSPAAKKATSSHPATSGRVSPSHSSSASSHKKKPQYKTPPPSRKMTSGNKSGPKRKPTHSKGKTAAIAVISVFLIAFVALFAYGYSILGKISYDDQLIKENQYIDNSQLASDSKVKNILFIGSDARNEIDGMRSDTMMLFSIDTANKKIKLTSFLRDSYVCIPSTMKYKKLNAACSSGGAQLVIDTIEYNFKTEIDNYVLVDFEAFTKFINLLGGLDVPDVTAAEAKYLKEVVKVPKVKEGDNHFTGGATLWYCRIRYLDDDFHRTQRQRKVISAIIDTVAHTNPAKLVSIVSEIMPMIKTDISRNELLTLALGAITRYMHYDILQHQVPAKGTWSNASIYGVGAVLKMDLDKNAQLLEDFIYSEYKEEETTKKSKK